MLGKLAGWTKQVGESTHLRRLNIGPRLTLCFLFIILALLVGNAVSLWQFHLARIQADRLSGVDQELIAVLQAHTSLMSFYERLDVLAHFENTGQLVAEVEALRNTILQESQRSRDALSRLPPGVQLDPALLPTLLSIQDTLPAELEAIAALAQSNEWDDIRLRLANQVRPLEFRSAGLVENIDREVGEERAQAVLNIEQAQRRVLWILLITTVVTLLFAAFLGSAITRSITQPLRRLIEGSAALAGGDFSHRVPAAGKDEIARLGSVFNEMVVRLQELYRELQRRQTYLAEAQKLSHTGSFGWDVSSGSAGSAGMGEITYWSKECYRVLGFDPRKELPRFETLIDHIYPDDQAGTTEELERARREKTEFEFDFRIVHPGGEIRDIHTVGHPVFSPSGDLVEFVGTVIDVTERKRAEEERERLRQVQADLAHLSRVTTMGELTASLAHEIRQPITAARTDAKTCLRWLGRDNPDLAEASDAASRVVKDVERAADIISRISLLFQKGAPQRELVDVNEVIREMFVLLYSEANRYSIPMRTELAEGLPRVMVDRVQLQQVLMNLMLNGIDAMKGTTGGRELTIKSEAGDAQLLISVSDTGVGLPPEQADQIFSAFFTTKENGTGMGLPISRSIIESHGGRLWAVDNSGPGTTFQFTLPTTVAAPA